METGKAPIFIAASLAGVSTLHQVGKAYQEISSAISHHQLENYLWQGHGEEYS